jgi:hypothetical protein
MYPRPFTDPWGVYAKPAAPQLFGACKRQGRCVCGNCAGVRSAPRFVFPSDKEGLERLAMDNQQEKQ